MHFSSIDSTFSDIIPPSSLRLSSLPPSLSFRSHRPLPTWCSSSLLVILFVLHSVITHPSILIHRLSGQPVGCYNFDSGVTCCEISADGDCAVACVPGSDAIITLYSPGGAQDDALDKKRRSVYGDSSKCGETFDVSKS